LLVSALVTTLGCSDSDRGGSATPPAAATSTPAAVSIAPRTLGETEREAMLSALREETGSDKKVWFAVSPGDRETAALKTELEGIFKEAGWETKTQTVTGMNLKPGLFFMAADEEPPAYVGTAQRALEASGMPMTVGSGYRAYYDEKKKEDPNWAGIPLAPDQSYVVVIGRNPPPA
jgi:hypothetical protein